MSNYDAIVLGCGGVGSSALFHLALRGQKVLGIERFTGGHDQGSSHGQTRIIRKAYFEHPDYVPLLERAYQLWFDLERRCGQELFRNVGLVQIGPPAGEVVRGVLESARLHRLSIETWEPAEAAKHVPGFVVPPDYLAVFEKDAGYLHVERCVLTHLDAARKLGATIQENETVVGWDIGDKQVVVRTTRGQYSAKRLVITAGAWATQLLSGIGVPLRVLRKHLHWFRCNDQRYHQDRCPTFLFDLPQGCYYGFPCLDDFGFKVAEHSGGTEIADPLTDPRSAETEDNERVRAFVKKFCPGVSDVETKHAACFYTVTPDHNFVIDRHPSTDRVVFAAGLSGHGFKFASVLGEVLADLSMHGKANLPIEFLGLSRFRS